MNTVTIAVPFSEYIQRWLKRKSWLNNREVDILFFFARYVKRANSGIFQPTLKTTTSETRAKLIEHVFTR